MKNILLTGLISAVGGGLVAVSLHNHFEGKTGLAFAQELQADLKTTSPLVPIQRTQGDALVEMDDQLYSAEELSNIQVYENANRSTVNINTRTIRNGRFSRVQAEGSGSGWILDRNGHIVTNYHVIENSDSVEVTLSDGNSYQASIVGDDPANDIAVLKIDAPVDSLVPLELGDSSNLKVGQRVYAIGNPFGLQRTMTTGIISSLNRSLNTESAARTIKNVIQIDAALNQGNSGGPLLDRKSRLIGMNTAIATLTGENTGVGFAVPVNAIRRIVPELIRSGRIVRADMGLFEAIETELGLLIVTMDPEGPAAKAGLKSSVFVETERTPFGLVQRVYRNPRAADIIQSIDGQNVRTKDDFHEVLDSKKPGQRVTVGILRNGRPMDATVLLTDDE